MGVGWRSEFDYRFSFLFLSLMKYGDGHGPAMLRLPGNQEDRSQGF